MSNNKIKKLLKQYGVEKYTKEELYEIEEEKIKKVQLAKQKEREKFERLERISSIQNKIENPFSLDRKFDTDNVRQEAIDNILPKAFIPEQTSYPEPFEEEPALNKELADFKKKIGE